MKFRPFLFVFLMLTIPVFSAQNGNDSLLIPLSVGNMWVYEVTEYSDSFDVMKTYYDTVSIVKDTNIMGDHWFYQLTSSNGNYTMVTNFDGGVYWMFANRAMQKVSDPFLAFAYPAAAGTLYPFANFTAEVVDTALLASTPFGQKECYLYLLKAPESPVTVEFIISPGVGVLSIVRKQNDQVMVTTQLAGMKLI